MPFFIRVRDLQHRRQPYFPEVSLTCWTGEERERLYQATLPRAARIITGTEVGKYEIVHFYGVQPEQVVVNPFPLPESLVRPDEIPDKPDAHAQIGLGFLLYPAQFRPHKNYINLLLALRVLRERDGLTPTLVLVGADKDNLGHVQATTEALGLAGQVRMLGFVPDAALVALYRRAEALVFTSFFGPDNLPPLEAFGLECPVIAARVPGPDNLPPLEAFGLDCPVIAARVPDAAENLGRARSRSIRHDPRSRRIASSDCIKTPPYARA